MDFPYTSPLYVTLISDVRARNGPDYLIRGARIKSIGGKSSVVGGPRGSTCIIQGPFLYNAEGRPDKNFSSDKSDACTLYTFTSRPPNPGTYPDELS
ncbi:unnamed protein product, partial [Iphiclides podalirius]